MQFSDVFGEHIIVMNMNLAINSDEVYIIPSTASIVVNHKSTDKTLHGSFVGGRNVDRLNNDHYDRARI